MRLSNSAIQYFKSCRRAYQLKYIEGVTPLTSADALVRGRDYHSRVEQILESVRTGKPFSFDLENPKIEAMATAFSAHILPKIGTEIKAVEEWFEKPLPNGNVLVGRCDGILPDGRIIEHKTTSGNLDEAYIASLQNDEQILTYMWAYGVNEIVYTVCKVPAIRQKAGETNEEYYLRCCDWYSEDTEHKVGVINVYRSPEEIAEFEKDLFAISEEMANTKLFYRVPGNCMKWGRQCEYASICRNYDPQMEYVGFERRQKD